MTTDIDADYDILFDFIDCILIIKNYLSSQMNDENKLNQIKLTIENFNINKINNIKDSIIHEIAHISFRALNSIIFYINNMDAIDYHGYIMNNYDVVLTSIENELIKYNNKIRLYTRLNDILVILG